MAQHQSTYAQKGGAYKYSEAYRDWRGHVISNPDKASLIGEQLSIRHLGIRGNMADGSVIMPNGKIVARRNWN